MTVRELIELLSAVSPSAEVLVEAGEYAGDERAVTTIEYRSMALLGVYPNTVLLKRD